MSDKKDCCQEQAECKCVCDCTGISEVLRKLADFIEKD